MSYLVMDIGTGNVRVALTDAHGEVLEVASDTMQYHLDEAYPDAVFFEPDVLWEQLLVLSETVLARADRPLVLALTTTSQREGIVVLDKEGKSLIGMPNIDHRGREFDGILTDKDRVYQLTGRYPTSLFSAYKVVGLQKKRPDVGNRVSGMLSISDWAMYQACGVKGYEHSQASETLLYDVARKCWSEELCGYFGLPMELLPDLVSSGTVLGAIKEEVAARLGLRPEVSAVVGGADTQLAVLSTLPSLEDVVIISGTTTPVIKTAAYYITDEKQRTWTNSHTDPEAFILETNAGVTGLNYQRLKTIFYPNESYGTMEQEVLAVCANAPQCYAALGSLMADEKRPLLKGGFVIATPVTHALTRGHFVMAVLWDIACSIYENYKSLHEVAPHTESYVWVCGGGMQSAVLRQFLANLLDKEIRIRPNYSQATVSGGAYICNQAFGETQEAKEVPFTSIFPSPDWDTTGWYAAWHRNRESFKRF